uniref:Uncharacterized protein n=1 Tax=Chromera velia CCMP2878 TaxID=1169474 RepID=A0A0G4HHZ9_9ALVE|eukprot:Cvel_27768.t1-p1 / transcript=Cvel_27768.t1 / gene=Cvel_27768 / organism=Chromera_velia_CCMP2878 / gene_product=hypothetical protein / transcript_product=hypothetical protein / location=Cvel_scaffold3520:4164-6183(+) / protein_length=505 / sequence_SO=supercontig / SO=protein_coding / is_pseudo=false
MAGEGVREKILSFMVHNSAEPLSTLAIGKAAVGKDATKKAVNPTLYALEKKKKVRKVQDTPPLRVFVNRPGTQSFPNNLPSDYRSHGQVRGGEGERESGGGALERRRSSASSERVGAGAQLGHSVFLSRSFRRRTVTSSAQGSASADTAKEREREEAPSSQSSSQSVSDCIFVLHDDGSVSLRPDIRVHLYVSEPPCGDATKFQSRSMPSQDRGETSDGLAPLVPLTFRGGEGGSVNQMGSSAEGSILGMGRLLSKKTDGEGTHPVQLPARPSYEELLNGRARPQLMCCSDKVLKWRSCGLSGALLSLFLSNPLSVPLYSVTVGGAFSDLSHVSRALDTRLNTLESHPAAASEIVVQQTDKSQSLTETSCASSSSERVFLFVGHCPSFESRLSVNKRVKTSPGSLNWYLAGEGGEWVDAGTGRQSKRGAVADDAPVSSRLSKLSMMREFEELARNLLMDSRKVSPPAQSVGMEGGGEPSESVLPAARLPVSVVLEGEEGGQGEDR